MMLWEQAEGRMEDLRTQPLRRFRRTLRQKDAFSRAEDPFVAGLRLYLTRHAYSTVTNTWVLPSSLGFCRGSLACHDLCNVKKSYNQLFFAVSCTCNPCIRYILFTTLCTFTFLLAWLCACSFRHACMHICANFTHSYMFAHVAA